MILAGIILIGGAGRSLAFMLMPPPHGTIRNNVVPLLPSSREQVIGPENMAQQPPFYHQTNKLITPQELQEYLRADIMRRCSELTLLGWVGRAYLAVPLLFDFLFPQAFEFEPYSEIAAACFSRPGFFDCTFKEGSIGGAKGIPFRFQIDASGGHGTREATQNGISSPINSVKLVSIGCDLFAFDADRNKGGLSRMNFKDTKDLCETINNDASHKRLMVEAVTDVIFSKLSRKP